MRKSKAEWVVAGGKVGELAHCSRCGTGLNLGGSQPIPIVVAACDAFVELHKHCQPGDYKQKPAQTPREWADGRDTGVSSMTISSVMENQPSRYGHYAIPYDPADFGRCYRLLKLFPQWLERLPEVAQRHSEWVPFVSEWARMTELYEQELPSGKCPKLYELMKSLREKVATSVET